MSSVGAPRVVLSNGIEIPQLGFGVFSFELTAEDLAAIDDLDRDGRTGFHPDEVD